MTMKFTQSNLLIRGGLIDMFFCFKLNSYAFIIANFFPLEKEKEAKLFQLVWW